ncbi:MAG: DUF2341 domain-containing protein [Candidatus Parvarchaeota archaeon]
MHMKRYQASMEFLTTYGWAIAIILIVLAILYSMGIFSFSNSLPSSISGFYSTPVSSAAANSTTLMLDIGNGVQQAINITGITVNASGVSYSTFSCQYNYLYPSQSTVCVVLGSFKNPSYLNIEIFYNLPANRKVVLSSTGSITLSLSKISEAIVFSELGLPAGTKWNVTYNGVTKATTGSSISFPASMASESFSIPSITLSSGTILCAPSPSSGSSPGSLIQNVIFQCVPSNVVYYSQITISNSQASSTPYPFQQMINVTSSDAIWTRINTSQNQYFGQNVEFFYANGTIIPSWLEQYHPNYAIFWVKIGSIPGSSSASIYIGAASESKNLLNNVNDGEAPQLSSTYAEYDDGASVFNFYDNFAGTTLNTTKWSSVTTGGTITVNNGITIADNGAGSGEGIVSKIGISPNSIFEIYRASQTAGCYSTYALGLFNTATLGTATTGYEYEGWTGSYFSTTSTEYSETNSISTATPFPSAPVIIGIAWLATGNEKTEIGSNGAFTSYSDTSITIGSTVYPGIGNSATSTNTAQTDYWVRTRAYPPNGVMPSVSFGSVSSV